MDIFDLFTRKSFVVVLLLLLSPLFSFGQEIETVLSAPDNWKSEIIPFPLGFAQEIDFVGFEDLRFAPDWSDPTGPAFWTYMFVWYIEPDSAMTESKLTEIFGLYYDGLMGVNMVSPAGVVNPNQLDRTMCLFIKTNDGFTGKMRVYDKFFTKEYMVLNILVKESFCVKSNKQIIRCNISSKDFSDEVWKRFKEVKVKIVCE